MNDLYLLLLTLICTGLLLWGFLRKERVYQYPFFMGAIFVSFILPQAIALVNNPGSAPEQAVGRVLIMSCLCSIMCWLGYQIPPSQSFVKKLDISIEPKKLFYGGVFFVLIGYVSAFLISQLPEVVRENSTWTGIITIYTFFGSLIFPGFSIILLSTIQRPTLIKLILTVCAAALPLQIIILYGRREPTATFILTIGLSLYYLRKVLPSRWLVITFLIGTLLVIPLTGEYRSIAKTGNWSQLSELRPVQSFQSFVEEGQILELRNAALSMDAAVQTRQYGYGTDYWNAIISRFVPAQLVSYDFKKSLQFKPYEYNLEVLYKYRTPGGSTLTGIGDAFIQFDYVGCIFFLLISYLFKNLWISAVYRNSIASQVFYVSLFTPAMLSVTHGTVRFFPDFLFNFIFIGSVIMYSRRKFRHARN